MGKQIRGSIFSSPPGSFATPALKRPDCVALGGSYGGQALATLKLLQLLDIYGYMLYGWYYVFICELSMHEPINYVYTYIYTLGNFS